MQVELTLFDSKNPNKKIDVSLQDDIPISEFLPQLLNLLDLETIRTEDEGNPIIYDVMVTGPDMEWIPLMMSQSISEASIMDGGYIQISEHLEQEEIEPPVEQTSKKTKVRKTAESSTKESFFKSFKERRNKKQAEEQSSIPADSEVIKRIMESTQKAPVPVNQDRSAVHIATNTNVLHGPIFVGLCPADVEVDASQTVFVLASSLVNLGYAPLVCSESPKDIANIELLIFEGAKEDPEAMVFGFDGVDYMRPHTTWTYHDLMESHYSHIIFWYEHYDHIPEQDRIIEWSRTHIPLLLADGARWRIDRLHKFVQKAVLDRKISKLLLHNSQQDVIQEISKHYPDVNALLIPHCNDPFRPDKNAVKWVGQLLTAQKRFLIRQKGLWIFIGSAAFISIVSIVIGLFIKVP
ncbi:hypothetical protein EJP82_25900 [Paenibacillus anaericanus]|uniref:Uncharacterized protein n=1 Tax=Paenibacillus anaericanus TaxID=170367 RepID=A0A3S1BHA0_9BACL|nr:hypothetical protein [Paenibacillus anaericanus]RUT39516.1 hypothetical protein EJP82_25900 [Paenibacillus anaericanus]